MRFLNEPFSLWVKINKANHGVNGGLRSALRPSLGGSGVWCKIVGSINRLHDRGVTSYNYITIDIGNGPVMD